MLRSDYIDFTMHIIHTVYMYIVQCTVYIHEIEMADIDIDGI